MRGRGAEGGQGPRPDSERGGALRILVVTAAYPAPSDLTRAVFIENLCRALSDLRDPDGQARLELSVVAPRIARSDPAREIRRGIPVRRFPYPSFGRRLKEAASVPPWVLGAYLVSGLAAVLGEARRFRPALIHAHWVLPAGLLGAAVSRLLGIPLVLHAHGSDIHRYARTSPGARRTARWALRRALHVLAASGALRDTLAGEFAVEPGRLSVLPMGIDGNLFRPGDRAAARSALGLADAQRREILFVGDLLAAKGALDLARALADLPPLAPPLRLSLAGDGPDRPALEDLARRAPDRLRLLGRLDPEQLAPWYRAADLLVLPSRGEGTPVSILEALASGLPVVAMAVGGVGEVVRPGIEGWLVAADRSPQAFLAVVLEALGDRAALERMRQGLCASPLDRTAVERAARLAPILAEAAHRR